MKRDIKIIAKEIDWFDFLFRLNFYKLIRYLDVKTWDDVVLKLFPKLNLFDSKFLENKQLTSLDGCPKEFSGNFNCKKNQLTSLKGAPQEISGSFSCSYNQLTSLEGAPQGAVGSFYCSYNQLTSLEGAPQDVVGGFFCSENKLTSLKGSPQIVRGNFDCSKNELTSLEGAPQKVDGYLNCSSNFNLPDYKVNAYKAYLKLSNSEKAPLTKDDHYYPTEEWENKFK